MLGEEAGPAVSESERGPGRHRGGGEDKHILFSPLRELISSCRGAIHSGLGLDFGPSEDGPGKPGLEQCQARRACFGQGRGHENGPRGRRNEMLRIRFR